MFKLSRFNYHIKNGAGDLLLYNSLVGQNSFLKIPMIEAEVVNNLLKKKISYKSFSSDFIEKLIEKGYLIRENVNENDLLRGLYLETIGSTELELIILPTLECNFRCKYCYETFEDGQMLSSVQEAVVKFVEMNINKYSRVHVEWFGGEPLEGLPVIEYISNKIIDICRKKGKPYSSSMTTNGYLLSEKIFRKLLKYKILDYQLTIDGLKKIHDYQRPLLKGDDSTFDKIIENLLSIKKNITRKGFNITIRTNFSKELIQYISFYKEYFASRFGEDNRFTFFARPVMDWGGEQIKSFEGHIYQENKMIHNIYNNIINSSDKLRYTFGEFLNPCGGVCYASKKNSFVIAPNGLVYKCTLDFVTNPEAKIGKLIDNGIMQIDGNKAASWITHSEVCNEFETCFFAPNCLGEPCPARRVLRKDQKVKCPLEKVALKDTLLLLDVENNVFERISIGNGE
ncbi:hypothetical protein IGI37_001794 [Enterococcus sp. AZ194]|uniref:radical SAM protein n=1 Tax=Enterococcus sp. AZ194 TaxID=2774629 RepID=UPI003F223B90